MLTLDKKVYRQGAVLKGRIAFECTQEPTYSRSVYDRHPRTITIKGVFKTILGWPKQQGWNSVEAIRRHERTGRPLEGNGLLSKLEVALGRSVLRGTPGPAAATTAPTGQEWCPRIQNLRE